jgi:glycosyltransferase involved in cell wall biosynthesis
VLVAHVIHSLAIGGAEQELVDIVTATGGGSTRHLVCALGPPDDLARCLEAVACPVHRLHSTPQRRYPFAYRPLRRLLAQIEPDVLQSWMFHARFATTLANRDLRRPHVACLQGTDYDPRSIAATGLSPRRMALQCQVERLLARSRTTRYVAASSAVRDAYALHVPLDSQRIRIIPNAVDPDRVAPAARARALIRDELGVPDDTCLFLNVARMIPGKGHAELLAAFGAVASSNPRVGLALVGDGPLRTGLEKTAGSLPGAQRIHFAGGRADVPALLAAADAFVLPSHSEGFSLALAEAMLAGLPCIATDIPATREAAGEPSALMLGPPDDASALAGAMATLSASPELRRQLSALGRERAERCWSIHVTAQRWLDLYDELCP